MIPPPPISTLFPYTTLFRSEFESRSRAAPAEHRDVAAHQPHELLRDDQPEARAFLRLASGGGLHRSEEHTSELQSQSNLVCRLLLEKKKKLCPHRPPREQTR